MKKIHPGILLAIGGAIGAAVGVLVLHKPTREKVKGHLKIVRKHVVKTVKEKADKVKV